MFYRDFKPDVARAFGTCEDDEARANVTSAVRLLVKSGLFDPNVGDISVCVCENFVTLPAEVETVLGVTVDAAPALIRNEWFAYHVNGPGDANFSPCGMADMLGTRFPTIRDPDRPVRVVTRLASPADQNKKLRVFGWDAEGNRILGPDHTGTKRDGFFVPMLYGQSRWNEAAPPIARIEYVSKDPTVDVVELLAVDPADGAVISLLGSYRPSETLPLYTRIRISGCNVARVKFKRRLFDIRDDYDWIPVDNRLALFHACRSVKYGIDGKYQLAEAAEITALRYLRNDTAANTPGGIAPPQVICNEFPSLTSGSSLFYGGARRGAGRFRY